MPASLSQRLAPHRRRFVLALAMPLAGMSALALLGGVPQALGAALFTLPQFVQPMPPLDREEAQFAACAGPVRETCVVDGESLFYRGVKYRLADIDAPAIATARCPAEAALGRRARTRLAELLGAGSFTLAPAAGEYDAEGRRLQRITRADASLGAALVSEGLARPHRATPRDWCGA